MRKQGLEYICAGARASRAYLQRKYRAGSFAPNAAVTIRVSREMQIKLLKCCATHGRIRARDVAPAFLRDAQTREAAPLKTHPEIFGKSGTRKLVSSVRRSPLGFLAPSTVPRRFTSKILKERDLPSRVAARPKSFGSRLRCLLRRIKSVERNRLSSRRRSSWLLGSDRATTVGSWALSDRSGLT